MTHIFSPKRIVAKKHAILFCLGLSKLFESLWEVYDNYREPLICSAQTRDQQEIPFEVNLSVPSSLCELLMKNTDLQKFFFWTCNSPAWLWCNGVDSFWHSENLQVTRRIQKCPRDSNPAAHWKSTASSLLRYWRVSRRNVISGFPWWDIWHQRHPWCPGNLRFCSTHFPPPCCCRRIELFRFPAL